MHGLKNVDKYCGKAYYKHAIKIHKSGNHTLCDIIIGSDSLSLMFVTLLHCFGISCINYS